LYALEQLEMPRAAYRLSCLDLGLYRRLDDKELDKTQKTEIDKSDEFNNRRVKCILY
jgi:hypothetical protein